MQRNSVEYPDPLTQGPGGNPRIRYTRPAQQLTDFIVIALLPVLVLFRTRSPIFSPAAIDPWVYLGFFTHLKEFKSLWFPGTYYGSRLSWILPGHLLYSVFSPVLANYVLHLLVFYTAVGALYYVLRVTVGRRTALLGAILFGFHPMLWRAAGRDYIDGPGIAYYVLALAFLASAAKARHFEWRIAAAGAAFACAIYCNLAWLPVAACLFAAHLCFQAEFQKTPIVTRIIQFVIWFSAGGTLLTVLFCVINYGLDGTFWFYAPSLRFGATQFIGGQWQKNGFESVITANFLIFPALACIVAVAASAYWLLQPRGVRKRIHLFFIGNLLANVAIWVAWEIKGVPAIRGPDYAGYLMPAVFLCLASECLFAEGLSAPVYWIGTAITALLWGAHWLDPGNLLWNASHLRVSAALLLCVPTVLILVRAVAQRREFLLLPTVAAFGLLTWLSQGYTYSQGASGVTPTVIPDSTPGLFVRVIDGVHAIDRARGGAPVRFWYDAAGPAMTDYDSLNGIYLWAYTYLSRNFPLLPADQNLSPGTLIVIPSSRSDALNSARQSLADRGLVAEPVTMIPVRADGVSWTLNVVRVERDPSILESLTETFDDTYRATLSAPAEGHATPLPAAGWQLGNAKAAMKQEADGIRVQTDRDQFGYAAVYKELVAPASGTYVFDLRYRPLSGTIEFGVVSDGRWRCYAGAPQFNQNDRVKECALKLEAGQRFMLVTVNWQATHPAVSSFVIEDLYAFQMKDTRADAR